MGEKTKTLYIIYLHVSIVEQKTILGLIGKKKKNHNKG
jgi:hypothetical protein